MIRKRHIRYGFAPLWLAATALFWDAHGVVVHAQTAQITNTQEAAKQREARQQELEEVARRIRETEERQERLKKEIDTLARDMGAINRALVAAGQRGQALEEQVAETEQRLEDAKSRQRLARNQLRGKSALLSEVLAALQRMGRNPPPALLVTPSDALQSVRSAILLGAVVPEIRGETEVLLQQVRELGQASRAVEEQRQQLTARLNVLAEDESRLAALVAKKQALTGASRKKLKQEQAEAERLARNATSLEKLINDLERRISAAAEAARAAREADSNRLAREEERLAEARRKLEQGITPDGSTNALLTADPNRQQPALAFSKALGKLPFPAAGEVVRTFGAPLNNGGVGINSAAKSIAIATRPNARVSAPADAWVVYAGPFRSFGKIVILNGGDNAHVVLAGLSQVNVEPGRFVLAGEPIGRMGARRIASALSPNLGSNKPVLTVEFRINGKPVDPAPWWAPRKAGSKTLGQVLDGGQTGDTAG
ncbi:MAG: peptidoglycan DD-metalloendopeptidase family protein [Pseudomonadota bacterium]